MIYKAYNESASNKNEVFNFISNNDVDFSKDRIDNDFINKIQKELGVKFGTQLVKYIINYGYLAYKGTEFYGINNKQGMKSDMITHTKNLHNTFPITKSYIAIENRGDGDYYVVDSNDNVFEFDSEGNRLTPTNYMLFEYILSRFKSEGSLNESSICTLIEGVTVSKYPNKEFNKVIDKFISTLNNGLKDLDIKTGLFGRNNDKLKNDIHYANSIEKAHKKLEKNASKYSIRINLNALGSNTVNTFGNIAFKSFQINDFTLKERSIIDKLSYTYVVYKKLGENNYAVAFVIFGDKYDSGSNYIDFTFKCADATDKTLKALKLNESTIFESTSFI